jgi:hypothetical protein
MHKPGCDTYGGIVEKFHHTQCLGLCSAEYWDEEDKEMIWCDQPTGHGPISSEDGFVENADHANTNVGLYFSDPPHMDKRQQFGVGYSLDLNANLQHLISPIVGHMQMAIYHPEEEMWRMEGRGLKQDYERLSFALQLIREANNGY